MSHKISILIILTLSIYSCKEEDILHQSELISTQSCQDNLIAENIFNDIEYSIKEGLYNNGYNKSCPNYILMNTDTTNVDTLIIDFGNTSCLHNGKIRKGEIHITFSGKYHTPYAVISTTFENYYINSKLIQGEMTITNQGINSDGNMWFTIEVKDAVIITSKGIINWQSNKEKIWSNGTDTYLDISDDEYKITGSSSGNGVNGNNFNSTIMDSLNIDMSCFPSCIVKSGSAKVYPNGNTERLISYGVNLCDCNVDIIINEDIYPIVIEN